MRFLDQQFMNDLCTGLLSPLHERVIADRTLCLEIRENAVNIYYRGGNLISLSADSNGYTAFFDKNYAMADVEVLAASLPSPAIRTREDVEAWLSVIPAVKQSMDLFLGRHPKEEREVQQLILRENNFGGISRATDYYLCDIEYANAHGRFDFVAVHWPSNGAVRKRAGGRRLVLGEVKFGDAAIADLAGIHSHIRDINAFAGDPSSLRALKAEMVSLFNQKRALGLINCGKDLAAFSDEPPILMLLLVNHDPESSLLRECLKDLPSSPHAEIWMATGCFMGYGLFDHAVVPLDQAQERFGVCF